MTTDTQLTIVEATREHAPFIAWVTLTAFRSQLERGFWDFMLDDDTLPSTLTASPLQTAGPAHNAGHGDAVLLTHRAAGRRGISTKGGGGAASIPVFS